MDQSPSPGEATNAARAPMLRRWQQQRLYGKNKKSKGASAAVAAASPAHTFGRGGGLTAAARNLGSGGSSVLGADATPRALVRGIGPATAACHLQSSRQQLAVYCLVGFSRGSSNFFFVWAFSNLGSIMVVTCAYFQ